MSSHFIQNSPCPRCGSKDNLSIWSDGHKWCFGCSYYEPPTTLALPSYKPISYNVVTLPEDATRYIPEHARNWLNKYSLTKEEICVLAPLYSFNKDLLIFPIYDMDKQLLMWQGRYFGDNEDHPKYLTYGAKDMLHILGPDSDRIVCVEDLVSAAKISSVTTVMPIFGSNIPLRLAYRLSSRFKRLTLWLDMDKAKESLKTRSKLSGLFDEVTCVVTPLDPKDYNHEEIKEYLQGLKKKM